MNGGETQMLDGAMVEISFAKECAFYYIIQSSSSTYDEYVRCGHKNLETGFNNTYISQLTKTITISWPKLVRVL